MSNRSMKQRCKDCRWWMAETDKHFGETGYCKRHAPSPRSILGDKVGDLPFWGAFPLMSNDDWCGEWEETPPWTRRAETGNRRATDP